MKQNFTKQNSTQTHCS